MKALQSILNWDETQLLEKLAPTFFITPLGHKIKITYENELPEISIRIQEMFGQKVHPKSGGIPIRVTFLSPAGRKIQKGTCPPARETWPINPERKSMAGCSK